MLSIVTPTIRPNGLQRVYESLKNQTYTDFEWLVEINTSGETDFNQSMNKMIARAKGDIIVSIQDYIAIEPTALEHIANLSPAFYTFPVGKILKEEDEPRWDWRKHKNEKIHWQEWEICFGCAPRKALIDIGGFDEQLDQAWGFDNVNVGFRANQAGFELKCDNTISAIALDHDAFMAHPLKERRDSTLHNKRLDDFRKGVKIDDVQKYML